MSTSRRDAARLAQSGDHRTLDCWSVGSQKKEDERTVKQFSGSFWGAAIPTNQSDRVHVGHPKHPRGQSLEPPGTLGHAMGLRHRYARSLPARATPCIEHERERPLGASVSFVGTP